MADISEAAIKEPPHVSGTARANESPEQNAQKKAKMAPLHTDYFAPLSFLENAVEAAQNDKNLNMTNTSKPFGRYKEALARECYEEIVSSIVEILPKGEVDILEKRLFIIRGSPGIGKSTFLAYFIVRLRGYFRKIILCHASKSATNKNDTFVQCQVWEKGQTVLSGSFGQTFDELNQHVGTTDLIVMDECSLPLTLTDFKGVILMAAPPGLYVKNMEDSVKILNRKSYTMPALSQAEALIIAKMIGVDENVVKANFECMNGITRFLFEEGAAKLKVQEAIAQVDASSISKMVSMQAMTNSMDLAMVHSLVLWKADGYDGEVRFELISRFAERLVAKKLAQETTAKLEETR